MTSERQVQGKFVRMTEVATVRHLDGEVRAEAVEELREIEARRIDGLM